MLKIFGYNFSLHYVGSVDSAHLGHSRVPTEQMSIAGGMTPAQTASTILHEILEVIKSQLNLDVSHQAIAALETGLYQVLTENGVDLAPLLRAVDD